MRELPVDLSELEWAFQDSSWSTAYYLDLQTGQVITITEEIRQELENLYEEAYDENEDEQVPWADVLQRCNLPEWMKEELQRAHEVEKGYGTRYLGVPQADPHEGYRDMEEFIATVPNERLQDHLWRAIRGRGAFRYFKDVLVEYPEERERWFAFRDTRLRQRIQNWLEGQDIRPLMDPPSP